MHEKKVENIDRIEEAMLVEWMDKSQNQLQRIWWINKNAKNQIKIDVKGRIFERQRIHYQRESH